MRADPRRVYFMCNGEALRSHCRVDKHMSRRIDDVEMIQLYSWH